MQKKFQKLFYILVKLMTMHEWFSLKQKKLKYISHLVGISASLWPCYLSLLAQLPEKT